MKFNNLLSYFHNCIRVFIFALSMLGTASAARAQSIEHAGRVAFELAPFQLESLTLKGGGGEVDSTNARIGLGGPNLGIHLSYGLSEFGLVGARLLVAYQSVDVESEGENGGASATYVYFLPHIGFVLSPESSTRPSFGLNMGYFSNTEETEGNLSVTTQGFAIGPNVDAYIFVDRSVSVDLGVIGLYEIGSSDIEGADADLDASGFYLGLTLGASIWWGGRSAQRRDSNRREADDDSAIALRSLAQTRTSRAAREFDSQRDLHIVRADFVLSKASLRLTSAPQVDLDTIDVRFSNRILGISPEQCKEMKVLINKQSFTSDKQETESFNRRIDMSGRFKFEVFKPLSRKYSSFGIEACGRSLNLSEADMETLKKFLVMVSQVATDVQQGRIPRRASESSSETESDEAEAPQGTQGMETSVESATDALSETAPTKAEETQRSETAETEPTKDNASPRMEAPAKPDKHAAPSKGKASEAPEKTAPKKVRSNADPDAAPVRENEPVTPQVDE